MEIAVLAIIFGSITLIVSVVTYFKTRHRERLALIKYDKDARIFKKNPGPSRGGLKLGLVALAGGVGLIVGSVIDEIFFGHSGEIGTFACLLIFGGMALIYYYRHFADKEELKNAPYENVYEESDEMV